VWALQEEMEKVGVIQSFEAGRMGILKPHKICPSGQARAIFTPANYSGNRAQVCRGMAKYRAGLQNVWEPRNYPRSYAHAIDVHEEEVAGPSRPRRGAIEFKLKFTILERHTFGISL
jgi:hypothetical protein